MKFFENIGNKALYASLLHDGKNIHVQMEKHDKKQLPENHSQVKVWVKMGFLKEVAVTKPQAAAPKPQPEKVAEQPKQEQK